MRILVCLIALMGVVVSVSCQVDTLDAAAPPKAGSSPASTPLSDSPAQEITTPDRVTPMATLPERVPPSAVTAPEVGEVPMELLVSILKDLAERTGAAPEKIAVTQAQAIVWNEGSLGCPQPGMFYTQALVSGYRVVLEVEGQEYDYRVADNGYFFLCEGGPPQGSPSVTPSGLLIRDGGEQELIASVTADLASRLGVSFEEIEVVDAGRTEVPLAAPCGVTAKIEETGPIGSGLTLGQEILLQHGKTRYRYVATGGLVHFCGEF